MINNPFNPSFGMKPTVVLNRNQTLDQLVADIKKLNTPFRTTLIYGTRGVGKTIYMNAVGQEIQKDPSWAALHLIISNNMVEHLASLLYQKATTTVRNLMDQIIGVKFSIAGVSIQYDRQSRNSVDYQVLLERMLTVLKHEGQHVLVMIDEAQDTPGLVELASVYQVLISEELPISVIMTGLPKNVQELQNNHALTFLLRSGRVNLSPLDYFDIRTRYQQELSKRDPQISPELIRKLAQLADGYAYAFQLLGYLMWRSPEKHLTEKSLDQILPEFQAQLSRNAYRKMLEELSPVDQRFVVVMAHSGEYPVPTKYIGQQLKQKPGYIGVYRRRLIDSQIIESANYGYVKFTLPLFRKFMIDDGQYLIGIQ